MPTIQAKIIEALEPRSGQNDRGPWMVQEFVLESYDQYPRKCLFSVFGADRLQQYNIKAGDDLSVDIDIDAREYNGRYYNSVRAWRVTHIQAPVAQAAMSPVANQPFAVPQSGVAVAPPPPIASDPLGGDTGEDLPF